MLAVFKRELKAYFSSPLAYVIIAVFFFIFSLSSIPAITSSGPFLFGGFLYQMGFWMCIIIPIITMRVFAEERKNGTEVLLITSPRKVAGIVLGKYLASLSVFVIMTLTTLIHVLVLLMNKGTISLYPVLCSYAGFIGMGAVFIAFGILTSALTESQIIAAVMGVVGLLIAFLVDTFKGVLNNFKGAGSAVDKVVEWLFSVAEQVSLIQKFREFVYGAFNSKDIVYFISVVGLFLVITMLVIEKRRWSQG